MTPSRTDLVSRFKRSFDRQLVVASLGLAVTMGGIVGGISYLDAPARSRIAPIVEAYTRFGVPKDLAQEAASDEVRHPNPEDRPTASLHRVLNILAAPAPVGTGERGALRERLQALINDTERAQAEDRAHPPAGRVRSDGGEWVGAVSY